MKYLLLLFLLLPICCFAQLKIEGKVVNATDGKPISDASVFINNATIGTKAGSDGSFTLYKLTPGHYDLIVSVIGYETYRKTITVNSNMVVTDVKMMPKNMMMREVRIGGDPKWKQKLKEFKQQFIGFSHLPAGECNILNPEVLELNYSKDEQVLTAKANGFMEIDNDILGYKLKYLLSDFVFDKKTGMVTYEGTVLFEEKSSTSELQKARWNKYRCTTYMRSPQYFFREVLANRADSNFLVLRRQKIFPSEVEKVNSKMVYDTIHIAQYIHPTETKEIYSMSTEGDLEIFSVQYTPLNLPTTYIRKLSGYLIADITFIDKYLYFDINGSVLNRMGVVFGQEWGRNRVIHLLPIDYQLNSD